MKRLREAAEPISVNGVLPAATISGMRSRQAFISMQTAFAVPTLT
jgi:hypothetical protein